jgi:hypothetical protein
VGKSERTGLVICAAVLAFFLVQAAGLIAWSCQDPEPNFAVVGAAIPLASIVLAFWKGNLRARWGGFVALAFIGVGLICSGYWLTTLDFPNAVSAAERVLMQENCRRRWPWWAAWGAMNILAGTLLLLPPVERFLHVRREALAAEAVEGQEDTT